MTGSDIKELCRAAVVSILPEEPNAEVRFLQPGKKRKKERKKKKKKKKRKKDEKKTTKR